MFIPNLDYKLLTAGQIFKYTFHWRTSCLLRIFLLQCCSDIKWQQKLQNWDLVTFNLISLKQRPMLVEEKEGI